MADAPDAPAVSEVVLTLTIPGAIALRGDELFVTSLGLPPAVFRAAKASGLPTRIDGATRPTYLSVDGTHLYWSDISNGSEPRSGAIRRAPLLGGATETLVRDLEQPNSVALTAADVYFAQGVAASEAQIVVVAKGGGATKTIATPGSWSSCVAANSTKLCWVRKGASEPAIQCAPLTGGASVTLADESARALSIDDTDAFFLGGGAIKRVSLAGGAVATLAAGLMCGSAIALDATFVYATCVDRIVRVPKAGGAATSLSTALKDELGWAGIAVDTTHVYWTSPSDDSVRRIPK